MANIELDGANKKITVDSGDLTLDIPGDIILDADGANVTFKDGGTSILDISNSSSDAVITSSVQDKDIIFKGDDGGSAITALTLDMSDAGAATFNGAITGGGLLTTGGNIIIPNAGNIGSASDTDAMAIASNGVVTFSQNPVFPNGGIDILDLDIDGATDIGANIVDADLFIIDDGAGGTNRKTTASRLKTYVGGGWTSATAQSPTSGTSFSFTSLPAGLSVIHVCLADLSCNGSGENFLLEIGDSGGFETSGYLSTVTHLQAGAGQGGTNSTAAFLIAQGPGASDVVGGVLTLVHLGSNLWSMGGVVKTSASYTNHTGGTKTLSAELDRINIKTSGTNTFDAGTVNLIYA